MQIEKEVELYLQLCCEAHMSPDSYRAIQPGDICWLITHRHWPILKDLRQTITLNGNFFILEIWHEVTEDGETPKLTEVVSTDTPLKKLHLQLEDMAERASRSFIEELVRADYWKLYPDNVLSKLFPDKRDSARKLISSIEADTSALREAITEKAPIEKLITLSENLEKLSEDLNQLRYS